MYTGDQREYNRPPAELTEWLHFVNECQAALGRLRLEGAARSSMLPVLLSAAAPLQSHATRLLARSIILRIAGAPTASTTIGDAQAPDDAPQPTAAEFSHGVRGAAEALDFRVRAVLDHVATGRFDTPRLLAHIAKTLRVSPAYLSRLVVSQTGAPFSRHLQVQRMKESARLLHETDLSVKEIASAAGYGHVPSFDRQFRQFFHLTPTQYRQRIRGEARAHTSRITLVPPRADLTAN